MGIENIVNNAKDFLVRKANEYPGERVCAAGNGIKAGLGLLGAYAFDSYLLQTACLAYAVIKGVQCAKDLGVFGKL